MRAKATWKEDVDVGRHYSGSYRAGMERYGPNWHNNGSFEDGSEPSVNCLNYQNNNS
jgi:hypothetical protein